MDAKLIGPRTRQFHQRTWAILHHLNGDGTDDAGNIVWTNNGMVWSADCELGAASGQVAAGTHLSGAHNDIMTLGTKMFTVDFWAKKAAGANLYNLAWYTDNNNQVSFMSDNTDALNLRVVQGGVMNHEYVLNAATYGFVTNTWMHYFIGRAGANLYVAVNGVWYTWNTINGPLGEATSLTTGPAETYRIGIATAWGTGRIDELRCIVGQCLHQEAAEAGIPFIPATAEYILGDQTI